MHRRRATVARRVGLARTIQVHDKEIVALLEAGDSEGVAVALTNKRNDPDIKELYLGALRATSLQPMLADGVEHLLDLYLGQGFDKTDGYATALTVLLEVGSLRRAMVVFARSKKSQVDLSLPDEVHRRVLHVLGSCGQLDAALSHIHSLFDRDEPRVAHFNALLSGLAKGRCSNRGMLAARVISVMSQAGVVPDSSSLALFVDACTYEGLPGFLASVGSTALTFARQFSVLPTGDAILSICSTHLRSGDLEASYHWFLAGQLAEQPVQLNSEASEHTMEIVSQLARSLAVNGQATRLQRLLEWIRIAGGRLPASASSVSLAGYSCGRTLATIWMEPPAEVLRRRAVWSSDESTKVMCAQQYEWKDLDKQRHEVSQWLPYLAPDVKLERAWLMQLRATDHGALGLVRDWWGEGPAAAVARERLNEDLQFSAREVDIDAALQCALRLELPKPAGDVGASGCAYVCPELQTWRVNHADNIKRAFLTPSRIRASSASEFRQVLLNDENTRLMVPKSKAKKVFSRVEVEALLQALRTMPEDDVKMLESMLSEKKLTLPQLKKACEDLGLMLPEQINKADLVTLLVSVLLEHSNPESARPIQVDEVEEVIGNLEEATLLERWRNMCGATSSEASSVLGSSGLMGKVLGGKVASKLQQERNEDQRLEGSAEDELRLAVKIVKALRDIGMSVSRADARALCTAAHAVNDPQLAADTLRVLPPNVLLPPAESEQPKLGPAGQRLTAAMVRGGWEPQSAAEFLLGERPIPRRAGGAGLGGLATRYLDPLLGHGSNEDSRAELLKILTEGAEENATLDSYADKAIFVTTIDEQEIEIRAVELLEKLFKNSGLTEEVLRSRVAPNDSKMLQALGLPDNLSDDGTKKLMNFARLIWSRAKEIKAAAEQETHTLLGQGVSS